MSIFKRKKQVEVVDERTELEIAFEEKGQQVGIETGKIVQKGVDKYKEIKDKIDKDERFDKVRDFKDKSVKAVDDVVEKVTKKVDKVVEKAKK